jgi:hypothetical protein
MTDPTSPAATPDLGTVIVEDLDLFATLVMRWHAHKVAVLTKLAEIPTGSGVQVNDGATRILEGDLLAGFKLGIETALIELGQLPFAAETDDAPAPKH